MLVFPRFNELKIMPNPFKLTHGSCLELLELGYVGFNPNRCRFLLRSEAQNCFGVYVYSVQFGRGPWASVPNEVLVPLYVLKSILSRPFDLIILVHRKLFSLITKTLHEFSTSVLNVYY
jgi:hypothetical protein